MFRIDVKLVAGKSVGTIVLGSGEARTITGDTCAEVISALAFVAAVSVDPAVALGLSSSAEAGATGMPGSASASASISASIAPPVAEAATAAEADAGGRAAPAPAVIDVGLRVTAGIGLAAFAAGAAGVVVYLPVHLEIRDETPRTIAPSVRLSIGRGSGDGVETTFGTGRFRWTLAQLDACPLRIRVVSTIALRPCGGLEGGTLVANGETVTPRSETRPWMAARLQARIEWLLFDTLMLDGHVGLAAPFVRDRFVFDPARPVYRIPAVYPFAGVSLGVFFW